MINRLNASLPQPNCTETIINLINEQYDTTDKFLKYLNENEEVQLCNELNLETQELKYACINCLDSINNNVMTQWDMGEFMIKGTKYEVPVLTINGLSFDHD